VIVQHYRRRVARQTSEPGPARRLPASPPATTAPRAAEPIIAIRMLSILLRDPAPRVLAHQWQAAPMPSTRPHVLVPGQ
jgi:hypothetical protein